MKTEKQITERKKGLEDQMEIISEILCTQSLSSVSITFYRRLFISLDKKIKVLEWVLSEQ